jgi:hypothetical protein
MKNNFFYSGFIALIFMCFLHTGTKAQLLDKIKYELKWKAEQKAREKANEAIDKAIDSIGSKKKNKKGKKDKPQEVVNNEEIIQQQNEESTVPLTENTTNEENVEEHEGFIEAKTNRPFVFITGMVTITGKSIYYKSYKKVRIVITGPDGYYKENNALLSGNGAFTAYWFAPNTEGDYTVLVFSSDDKATHQIPIQVYDIPEIENMATENSKRTKSLMAKIETHTKNSYASISNVHKAEFENKLAEFKRKTDAAIKLYESINEANKKLIGLIKKGKAVPPNTSYHLSNLNDVLYKQAEELKSNEDFLNHKSFDNTICELLVFIKELSAAFSTLTYYENTIVDILKNIALDKIPPAITGQMIGDKIPAPYDFIPKELDKLYITAIVDGKSLQSIKGKAGVVNDFVGFIMDVLLKALCGSYSGEATQTFTFTYINKEEKTWWRYGGTLKANITLRYPKDKAKGKIIKMKGCLDGNATNFTFFADPLAAVSDQMNPNNKTIQVFDIADITPVTIPFSASKVDETFGFGVITRTALTPACFFIPIDAEYNVDTKQMKLYINNALIDFTPIVSNKKIYVVWAVLPLFKWTNFPIEKAQKIIRGSLKDRNWFSVNETKNTQTINETITRNVNQSDFSINLSLNINAKKD